MTAKSTNKLSQQYLWDNPALLIPVDVDALVVTKLSQNLQWAYNKMKYNNAGKFINVRPEMTSGEEKPGVGITLHWALPDCFTHGVTDKSTNNIKYPYAPNRWLIIRYFEGQSKAWILQSDFIDSTSGVNLFLDPNKAEPSLTRIGKVWSADQWPGEDAVKQQKFLVAIGPGMPEYAAFTSNVNGVFAFHDDMKDIIDKSVPVTYTIMGWYGNAGDDPLNNFSNTEEWLGLMDEFQLTVGDANDLQKAVNDWTSWAKAHNITITEKAKDIYPSRTICQGMVYNVNWLGQYGKLQSGVPQYDPSIPANKQPKIAVANTSIDALAALIKYEMDLEGKEGAGAAELLEALNYNLLDKYEKQGGQYEIYREIFKAWFDDQDSENYYTIGYKKGFEKPDSPSIEPQLLEKLVDLNKKSELLNHKQNLLKASQKGLYGDWWKTGKADTFWGTPPIGITKDQWKVIQQNLKNAIPIEQKAVSDLQKEINKLASDIKTLIEYIIGALPEEEDLKKNISDRYHEPNDPVVLVYGAKRSYRHGEDGRFDEDGKLFTRFTGQNIFGLEVALKDQKEQPVLGSDVTLPPVNLQSSLVPKETGDLCLETFFFDTLNAEAIAKAACNLLKIPFTASYTEDVAKQQTSAWNADVNGIDKQLVTEASGFFGTVPSIIAVKPWSPPWCPLYMAWEINWHPSYTKPSEAMDKWKFDNKSLEYIWDDKYDIGDPVYTLKGHSLLTPKSTFVMQAQLEKYFEDTGKFPKLKEFLDDVSNWDFLTQSMSELDELLLSLSSDQLNQPPATISDLVGSDMAQLCPIPDDSVGFFPIRAGHFQISKLWVVDDFGQVFDPISAVGEVPANYHPVLGTGMITENKPNLVQLPPRLTQPSRLNINFVCADNSNDNTLQENQTINPICGWLLPNHIDKALSVYTPDGHLLGELILTGSLKKMKLRWDNAPGKNTPVGEPLENIIENEYVRSFVEKILQREDNADSFMALLSIIDETLWTVEPLGGRKNELVSVYIGRPLALVKSTMKYEFMEGADYSQDWLNSTLKVTKGYENIKYPVQVGNTLEPQDGTIGYFLEDFSTFSSLLSSEKTPQTDYITNNNVSIGFSDAAKDIFILVDPRGEINTISGILPIEVNVLQGTLVEDAMSNMNVTFRTGPLITDPDKLSMPLPSEMSGEWSWIKHSGVSTWEEISNIAQGNAKARIGKDYELTEGWLKLTNALKEK